MALSRRNSGRFSTTIWPGFVDAMTALILVLFFVLSIFMIVQFVLRDELSGQSQQLDELNIQVANLADALGLERSRADRQAELVATVTSERDAALAEINEFEARVSTLLAENTDLADRLEASEAESAERLSANEALQRLAAELREENESLEQELVAQADALSEAESERLAAAAAAEVLRERLENSSAELTAMSLALEEERRKAEETLTLLAAAEAAQTRLESLQESRQEALSEAEQREAELAQARELLAEEKEISAEGQRQVALLNQQTASLREQLNALQGLLDEAREKDLEAQVQIEMLGINLNAALARAAAEERARAELERRERERLGEEAQDLRRYRSEFFGRMREILGSREGVRIVGDRFVFDSEVLFAQGSATLGAEGRAQISEVSQVLKDVSSEIPGDLNWILRVDGHTDKVPVGFSSQFDDNWELSTARALSVVQYMVEQEGIPPERLAAAGFGEFQPIDPGNTPEAYERNRRIELKFTER
ncbi:peptidoglycan -binding protein [Amaricoccus macauensis]|uniref:peptidoglycan -binding protein n=1 Tax=Amaricoccus macauensis TaxID=57001 RepID=UPI003C7BB3AB